ncbi:MAG: phosphoribosylaminoimidazolesuccinocarboxamide synthase [Sulfolobales archaeon]
MTYELIYEGKTKRVYVKNQDTLLLEFKDVVTALDGVKKLHAPGKGVLNAAISAFFFRLLEAYGVKTHFIDYDGVNIHTVRRLKIIPIEVVVRNYAYGGLIKRLPLFKQLEKLSKPLIEFHYKSDELHDPLILPEDILNSGLMNDEELNELRSITYKVNDILTYELSKYGLRLIDLKVEFGRELNGKSLILADEISGDSIRVVDEGGNHLDKEVFRKGGSVEALLSAYSSLACRLGINVEGLKCT